MSPSAASMPQLQMPGSGRAPDSSRAAVPFPGSG